MVELSSLGGPRPANVEKTDGRYGGADSLHASYEKGQDFLRQCAEMGVKPTLLTVDKLRDAEWPREVLEEVALMPADLTREQILNTV